MGRTAVFVDAGYLFARGSDALAGQTQPRQRLLLNEKQAVADIAAFAEARSGSPLLRVYWYDASSSQGPNADHIRLAETDDVKLRLGTLNTFGQQKGVDSLMIADLIELARNGAIESAVLISGDDDLRVGVQVAQTFGIRVHLLGITGSDGEAQSKLLVREADTCSRWTKTDVAKFLSLRDPAVAISSDPGTAASTTAEQGPESAITSANTPPAEVIAMLRATCERFLDALQSTDLIDIKTVYDATHKVPYQYDKRLLASARTELGRDLSVTESRALRNVFVEELRARLPILTARRLTDAARPSL
jgi:uncharacterized LabA/DUF88 family protein